MSFAIRGESVFVDGSLRKDYYIFNDITKLRLEDEDGTPLSFHQLTMHEGGVIQRFKATVKHDGKIKVAYTKSGKIFSWLDRYMDGIWLMIQLRHSFLPSETWRKNESRLHQI